MGKRRIIVCVPRFATGGPLALYSAAKYLRACAHDARVFWYGPWRRVPGDDLSYWYYRTLFNLVDASKAARVKLFGAERYEGDARFAAYSNESMQGVPRKFLSSCGPDDVVVYPEEIYGNPLGAKNVVRWLLYHNRYKDDPNAYGPDDQFFCYRYVFNDDELNPLRRQLYVCHYDLNLYRQTNFGERKGTCYLIKKGAGRADLPAEFDGPIIDTLSERDKVAMFNACERFVSYDMQTAYSYIAAMCGCESVVMPEPGKTYEDYRQGKDVPTGVAFGTSPEELARAAETRHLVREKYRGYNAESFSNAEKFGRWVNVYFDARDAGATAEELYRIDLDHYENNDPDERLMAYYLEHYETS